MLSLNNVLLFILPGIQEESPKGVLKRQENDVPKTKNNSGYRSSPRTSTNSDVSGESGDEKAEAELGRAQAGADALRRVPQWLWQ